MSDEEKKVKLDELPDEGSEPRPKVAPAKKIPKKAADPRLQNFKVLNDKAKVEVMEQAWNFDVPEFSFNWVPWFVTLAVAEWSGYFGTIKDQILEIRNNQWILGADVLVGVLEIGAMFIAHPIIFLALFPFIFKWRKESPYRFTVKFDGIDTVESVLPYGSTKVIQRKLVKWATITDVQKKVINNKEILSISSLDGHIADIIWYIDIDKKRAFELLLNGMIHPKHPLRLFLEQEKDL